LKLENYVGQEIHIVFHGEGKPHELKLWGVDIGGIWIESQDFTEASLAAAQVSMSDKTVLAFVPYHRIEMILATIDLPSFSERVLGPDKT